MKEEEKKEGKIMELREEWNEERQEVNERWIRGGKMGRVKDKKLTKINFNH